MTIKIVVCGGCVIDVYRDLAPPTEADNVRILDMDQYDVGNYDDDDEHFNHDEPEDVSVWIEKHVQGMVKIYG